MLTQEQTDQVFSNTSGNWMWTITNMARAAWGSGLVAAIATWFRRSSRNATNGGLKGNVANGCITQVFVSEAGSWPTGQCQGHSSFAFVRVSVVIHKLVIASYQAATNSRSSGHPETSAGKSSANRRWQLSNGVLTVSAGSSITQRLRWFERRCSPGAEPACQRPAAHGNQQSQCQHA